MTGDQSTSVPLLVHLEKISALEDKALSLAKENLDLRLQHLNDLRLQVVQDRSVYVSNEKFDANRDGVNVRIAALETWKSKAALVFAGVAAVAGAVGAGVVKAFGL